MQPKKHIIRFFATERARMDKILTIRYDPEVWTFRKTQMIFESKDTIVHWVVYEGFITQDRLRGILVSGYTFDESLTKIETGFVEWLNTGIRLTIVRH